MNCKPGDLAVIVRPEYPNGDKPDTWALGRIVVCASLYHWASVPCWRLVEALIDRHGDELEGIPDADLRPIRDPGDDATDETLLWLPVPSRTKEAA